MLGNGELFHVKGNLELELELQFFFNFSFFFVHTMKQLELIRFDSVLDRVELKLEWGFYKLERIQFGSARILHN